MYAWFRGRSGLLLRRLLLLLLLLLLLIRAVAAANPPAVARLCASKMRFGIGVAAASC